MAARRGRRRVPPSRRNQLPAARPSFYWEAREANAGRRYAERWHKVDAWAGRVLALAGFDELESDAGPEARVWGGSYYRRAKDSTRVQQRAVALVRDLTDPEEAYERGLPLETLDAFEAATSPPDRASGGYRRVVITALTWTPDHMGEVGYDPAWVTLGHGMTARAAAAAATRWVRGYAQALHNKVVSRELVFTALEVKFWTAPSGAKYV